MRGRWEQFALPDTERADQYFKRKGQQSEVVWCTWMPLRNVVGERARGPSGGDSEVKLGFRWTHPTPPGVTTIQGLLQEPASSISEEATGAGNEKLAKWTSGRFVLDGPEQILWMRESSGGIGRKTNIRFAVVQDETETLGPNVFSVTCASGSRFVGRALDDEDHVRWMTALTASSGLKEEGEPEPETPFCVRHRWSLTCCALLFITLAITLPVLFLVLLAPSPPPIFANASWGSCKGSPSAQAANIPADLVAQMFLDPSDSELVWCLGCDCFSRCVFGSSGGLLLDTPLSSFRPCSQSCQCVLPPPDTGCGNSIVQNKSVVDWFGQPLVFEEECDDGNKADGDGCNRWCRIEEFMMTESPALRSTANTTSLCGNSHTFSKCEQACLASPTCSCMWYGEGYCHLYQACNADDRIPAMIQIESTWDEVEFKCGLGNFVIDKFRQEIRSTVVLFGVKELNATGRTVFKRAFDSFCAPPCTVTILSANLDVLPLPEQQQIRAQLQSIGRKSDHRQVSETRKTSATVRATRETSAVFAMFKFTVPNTTAPEKLQKLTQFVNAGKNGLWGELRRQGLEGIEGVMFNYPDGQPKLVPKPAPPSDAGTLFRKVKYQCSEGNSYYSKSKQQVLVDNSSLCCGNRSQECYPLERPEQPKCYISSQRDYQCLPARTPLAPMDVRGVPYDERVHLYWRPSEDVGGYNISDFRVERVPFMSAQSLRWHTPESTGNLPKFCATGLTNFVPWYFRVTAINILGPGIPSLHSPAYTPWVMPADPPTDIRAATGNRRIYLSWRPPAYDGGRPLERILVEIAHDRYSRTKCSDPHGCVDDVLAHQALDGHLGHSGSWARTYDAEPSPDALEWSLVNAEPLSPDCLSAPDYDNEEIQSACPSLLMTAATKGTSGAVRLRPGVKPPAGEYPVTPTLAQSEQLMSSVFVANSPDPAWERGKCVQADGRHVQGVITLSLALAGVDEATLQEECHNLCMAHQTPPEWRDMKQYASGRKRGCELRTGAGWPTKGCYLHTSPDTQTSNGSPLHFCKVFNLPSATRRRLLSDSSTIEARDTALMPGKRKTAAGDDGSVAMEALRQNGISATALDAPSCILPAPASLLPQYQVLRDGQGNPLMNNYRYHLRVRAYNGFQPSLPSVNLTLHPVGEVPKKVLNLTAECFDTRDSHRCTSGKACCSRKRMTPALPKT